MAGFEPTLHGRDHRAQRLAVSHENLDDIGEVRHLARRSEETGERFDRAIPDIDLMAGLAQAFRDAASDDSLTDHPH